MWEVIGVTKNTTVFQVGEKPQPVAYLASTRTTSPQP